MTENTTEKEQSLVSHLTELRSRIFKIVLGLIIVFIVLIPFANDLYTTFAKPALENLSQKATFIIPNPMDAFLLPLKLCLFLSLLLTLPWTLYQVWGFIAPGLYKHERKLITPIVSSTTLLFYLGIVFAYFVVLPLVFKFLSETSPEGFLLTPDIAKYFSFVFTIFIAFGIAFEVPVATVLLIYLGVVSVETLKSKRRYVIVIAFVVGMVLTPPDLISQTLLAIPMLILFEIGLFFGQRVEKRRKLEEG